MTVTGPHGSDDRIDELIALAVLGEITEAEEAELDAALASRPDMVAELDADLAVAASVQATHAETPPPALKANVLAAIDALDTPNVGPDATSGGGVVDFAAAQTARTARTSRGWQPLAAAAAVVMLLIGGVLVAGRGGGGEAPSFAAVAQADDGQHRLLQGELGGQLDVVYSPSHSAFVLVGKDIPTLTDAETYQLWFVDGDDVRSVGLFRPHDDGSVEELFSDLDPSEVVVGVTVEPAAGSESPTLPIVAAA